MKIQKKKKVKNRKSSFVSDDKLYFLNTSARIRDKKLDIRLPPLFADDIIKYTLDVVYSALSARFFSTSSSRERLFSFFLPWRIRM